MEPPPQLRPSSTCVVLDHWKGGGGEADTLPAPLTLAFGTRSEVEHSFPLWQVPGNESGAAFGSMIRRPPEEGKLEMSARLSASFFFYLYLVWGATPPTPPPPTTEETAGAIAASQGEPVASALLCNTRALHKLHSAKQRHSEHVQSSSSSPSPCSPERERE